MAQQQVDPLTQIIPPFNFGNVVTVNPFTGIFNDYNPTGFSTANQLDLVTTTNSQISGFAGGVNGRILIVRVLGGFAVQFTHEDAGSLAANRINLPNGFTISVDSTLFQVVAFQYDGTTSRWKLMSSSLPYHDHTSISNGGAWRGSLAVLNYSKFGDGSDGVGNITVNTTLTRDMFYSDLNISAGVTLTTNGFIVYVAGTLTIAATGVIDNSGAVGGAGATGTGAGGAGGLGAGNSNSSLPSGTDGGVGGGVTAAATTNQSSLAATTPTYTNADAPSWFRGGGGGSGGGAHGTADALRTASRARPYGQNGGTGGAATGTGSTGRRGAGGGGGGGVIIIWVNNINNGGTIQAKGGAGGNGVGPTDLSGNGGGGGGGCLIIYYHALVGSGLGTLSVAGGAAGTGGNGGTAGGTGTSLAYNV